MNRVHIRRKASLDMSRANAPEGYSFKSSPGVTYGTSRLDEGLPSLKSLASTILNAPDTTRDYLEVEAERVAIIGHKVAETSLAIMIRRNPIIEDEVRYFSEANPEFKSSNRPHITILSGLPYDGIDKIRDRLNRSIEHGTPVLLLPVSYRVNGRTRSQSQSRSVKFNSGNDAA